MFYTPAEFAMQQQQIPSVKRVCLVKWHKKWRYRLGSSSLGFYCGFVKEKWMLETPPGLLPPASTARDKRDALRIAASFQHSTWMIHKLFAG
jgi:hypothetical protein